MSSNATITLGLLHPADSTEPPGLEGVGFWKRALARAIDLVVHFLVGAATGVIATIFVLIGAAIGGVSPDPAVARLSANSLLGFAAALVGAMAMHSLSEGLHGSTLGKRACGIIVIGEHGGPPNLVGAVKRSLAYYVDAFFFGMVAYQKMSESPKRQRIGDTWGHTMVVRIATLDAAGRPSGLRFAAATIAGLAADGLIIFLELAFKVIA
jgi:uncharacterized RDD family membrane protein YckC